MTVTEESRHRLHQKLDETLGEEDATTLMEHLPPVGWADIATKQDLDHLRTRIDANVDHRHALLMEQVDHRYAMLDAKIDARCDQIETKFGTVDERFKGLDERFKGLDERFEKIDAQFAGLGQQMVMLGEQMDRSDRRYEQLVTRVDRQFWQFIGLIVAITAIILAVAGAT